MKNDTIKIRCSVRKNLFERLGKIAGTIYYEKYDFTKFFGMITTAAVDQYNRQHKKFGLSYYEACCEYWLYVMFGWTEYDEEKYAELLEMPPLDLYNKLSLAYKKYLENEKLKSIKEDF